jgi:hypothetical protein
MGAVTLPSGDLYVIGGGGQEGISDQLLKLSTASPRLV